MTCYLSNLIDYVSFSFTRLQIGNILRCTRPAGVYVYTDQDIGDQVYQFKYNLLPGLNLCGFRIAPVVVVLGNLRVIIILVGVCLFLNV